jgi:tetratricopeptide (TPR) repeat protein
MHPFPSHRCWTSLRALVLLLSTVLLGALPAAAEAARESHPAEEEVRRIQADLAQADELTRTAPSLEAALVAFSRIGASLDVFEMRYGVRPADVAGWGEVQKSAEALLPRFRRLAQGGVYFDQDSAATANAILLELAGEPEKAIAALGRIKPGGGCGNWVATVMMAVAERQSGISQRMGDYPAALDHLDAARSHGELSLYHPNADLQLVRYGFLLAKVGREAEAIASYQRAVDLHPGTVADEIARRELTRRQCLIEPTAERITKLYLAPTGDVAMADFESAIFALAGHRFPESFAILSGRLETAAVWERNRLVPALGELGDPAALPLLREIVRDGESVATCAHALLALHKLGDHGEIVPYLEALKRDVEASSFELPWLHRILCEIHPDGPADEPDFDTEVGAFVDTWLTWLRTAHEVAAPARNRPAPGT